MGRYGELAKPADCKSVTLVVNIVGSNPVFGDIIFGNNSFYRYVVQMDSVEVLALDDFSLSVPD